MVSHASVALPGSTIPRPRSTAMSPRKSSQTIAIASDHAGYALKTQLKKDLMDLGYSVLDLGADSLESVDYPDFGYALAGAMKEGRGKRRGLTCGERIGLC